jgi:hypothetical protein
MVDNLSEKFSSASVCVIQESHNPLDEIIQTLNDFKDKSVESIDTCMNFFHNWNQLYTDQEYINLQTQLKNKSSDIKNLLNSNFCWIKQFLRRFTFIFLNDLYSHVEICELRSGIQYFIDFCKESGINSESSSDTVKNDLKYIDSALECWLNDHVEIDGVKYAITKKSYLPLHNWWNILSMKENLINEYS